jgi:beta-carotene 3-hydroxylase
MNLIVGITALLLTCFAMEFVAWAAHKYLMHGSMWFFHEDHHQPRNTVFEKNDAFFLIFAIPSWLFIMLGLMNQLFVIVWIGFGIALYGFIYFLIHDVYIHRRFKWLRDIDHPYFMAIRKAHKVHHKHLGKEHGECFGMLIVPRKYYIEAKKTFNKIYTEK